MIDTHSHLDTDNYDTDRDDVIKNAFKEGIEKIINISSDASSIDKVIGLSDKYDHIYAAGGIQPHSAIEMTKDIIEKIRTLGKEKKIIAIGEIGLDYHYNFSPPEIQRKVFREQLKLAKELNLPAVIHTREAFDDTINILKEEKTSDGVIHCFTEDREKGRTFIEMGFYLGIGGVVTFKNAKKLQDAIKSIPLRHIILETDCPYMAPTPYRGKRNEPKFLKFIAEKIARIKEIDIEEVKYITQKNSLKLFGIKT